MAQKCRFSQVRKKHRFCTILYVKCHHFTKTGWGQTREASKKRRFSQAGDCILFLEVTKKTMSLPAFHIDMMSLPRQARDKHGESTQFQTPFSFA